MVTTGKRALTVRRDNFFRQYSIVTSFQRTVTLFDLSYESIVKLIHFKLIEILTAL